MTIWWVLFRRWWNPGGRVLDHGFAPFSGFNPITLKEPFRPHGSFPAPLNIGIISEELKVIKHPRISQGILTERNFSVAFRQEIVVGVVELIPWRHSPPERNKVRVISNLLLQLIGFVKPVLKFFLRFVLIVKAPSVNEGIPEDPPRADALFPLLKVSVDKAVGDVVHVEVSIIVNVRLVPISRMSIADVFVIFFLGLILIHFHYSAIGHCTLIRLRTWRANNKVQRSK